MVECDDSYGTRRSQKDHGWPWLGETMIWRDGNSSPSSTQQPWPMKTRLSIQNPDLDFSVLAALPASPAAPSLLPNPIMQAALSPSTGILDTCHRADVVRPGIRSYSSPCGLLQMSSGMKLGCGPKPWQLVEAARIGLQAPSKSRHSRRRG